MSAGSSTVARGGVRDRALATLALASFSLAVAIGFCRVFSTWTFLGDLVTVIVVGHLAGLALWRVPLAAALPAQLAVTVWICGAVAYWDTYTVGVPTGAAWELVDADLRFASEQFSDAVAPVVYAGGWTALAVIGIGTAVLLADLFAFRAGARFEALVPGGVLFVIVGALGDGRDQLRTTGVMIVAAVAAVGALRALQRRPARIVIGSAAPRRARLVAGALTLGAVTAVAAGLVGPRLPGAASEPVYDTSGGSSDITRIESPLVDIRSRLVNQSPNEMFRVEANAPSYWRVATLSEFDGSRWKLDRSPLESTGELPNVSSRRLRIEQQITIGALRGQLVPAAAEPVEARGRELRWSERNATLLVANEHGLAEGDRLVIESVAPRFFPQQLDLSTVSEPPGGGRYLILPENLSGSTGELAATVTAGVSTPYQQALALQDWFRSEFDYSLEVQAGHGSNAIESFLRLRVGYCEQFAGTYAAMARTLGLPSRVAVGYTPGTYDEATGTYSVAGRNAHAWPELWFDDLGWVAFEPTPGRGAPGNERYTGVAPEQDTGAGPGGEPPGGGSSNGTPTTTAPAPVTAAADPSPGDQAVPNLPDDPTAGSTPVAAGGTGDGGGPDLARISTPVVIVAILIGIVAVAPAIIRRLRKQHIGTDPRAAIVGIYERLRTLVAAAGAPTTDAATPSELSRRAAQAVPGVRNDLRKLADAVTVSAFGPSDEVDAGLVSQCEQWYANVEEVAKTLLPWHVRMRRYVTLR